MSKAVLILFVSAQPSFTMCSISCLVCGTCSDLFWSLWSVSGLWSKFIVDSNCATDPDDKNWLWSNVIRRLQSLRRRAEGAPAKSMNLYFMRWLRKFLHLYALHLVFVTFLAFVCFWPFVFVAVAPPAITSSYSCWPNTQISISTCSLNSRLNSSHI